MISRIIQTEDNVICQSEAEVDNIDRGNCIILDIMQKPNPIIVLLYS